MSFLFIFTTKCQNNKKIMKKNNEQHRCQRVWDLPNTQYKMMKKNIDIYKIDIYTYRKEIIYIN